MIRALLIVVCISIAVTAIAWFVIPASTYIEDALGILMAVFVATMVIAVITQYLLSRKRPGRCEKGPA